MGEISGRYSDYTVITSDNPRGENPLDIIEDILVGIKKTTGRYSVIPDRREAIDYSLNFARRDDIVLIAGKGQENYQIIGDKKFPFDEAEFVRKSILKIKG